VFNNGPGRPGGDYSSVDEIVLPVDAEDRYVREPGIAYGPQEPVWRYTAPRKTDFFVGFMSGAQRLPNGNTFICDGVTGTMFEVTPKEEIVWKHTFSADSGSGPRGFGPPAGGFGGTPRRTEILTSSLRDLLKMSPEQKKALDELQTEVDARLEQTLTDDQKKRLRGTSGFGLSGFGAIALPGQIMSLSRQLALKPSNEQKKELTGLQKEVDDKLDQIFTSDQKAQFRRFKADFGRGGRPAFRAGGRPGFAPGGPGSPAGFGAPPGANPVFRAYRYGVDYPGLAGKELKPGNTAG